MTPGGDDHFRMILSSRWGLPLSVIDEMPASEFIEHKVFWDKYKWGVTDDLVAMVFQQILCWRTGKSAEADTHRWKDYASAMSGARKIVTSPLKSIREGFMSIIHTLSGKK